MELRCPDCCSPEVLPDPRNSPGVRRCGNCNARFNHDSALVTVADAESDLGKSALPHPLFGLDRDVAAVVLNDPEGAIKPITPFSDADELNGLFEAALGAEIITSEFESPTSRSIQCRSRIRSHYPPSKSVGESCSSARP